MSIINKFAIISLHVRGVSINLSSKHTINSIFMDTKYCIFLFKHDFFRSSSDNFDVIAPMYAGCTVDVCI